MKQKKSMAFITLSHLKSEGEKRKQIKLEEKVFYNYLKKKYSKWFDIKYKE